MTDYLSFTLDPKWRLKHLFFFNLFGGLLLLSLFSPITSSIWKQIDLTLFNLMNPPLKHCPHAIRVFWACANHRLADWFEDLCILGFYLIAIFSAPAPLRKKRIFQFIFCLFFTALTILLVNRLLCRDFLRLRRESPTLVVSHAVYLCDYISWMPIKVDSSKSFPADHATTALMFAFSYAHFVRGRLGTLAVLYGVFLCLPRLVAGAHWCSDIFVGSGCIVLFALSWAFFTPLADHIVARMQRMFDIFSPSN